MNPDSRKVKLLILTCVLASSYIASCEGVHYKQTKHHYAATASKAKRYHDEIRLAHKPKRQDNVVNVEWVTHYDEMLSKHGNQLNVPKEPGDRDGIQVDGPNSKVSPEVLKRYDELNKLDKEKK